MGQIDAIDIHSPTLGLNRALAYQSQPPYSSVDLLNVRSKDVFLERFRSGSRPGLVQVIPPKTFEIGGGGGGACVEFLMANNLLLNKSTPDSHFTDGGGITAQRLSSTNIARSVGRFDLSSIPASATITASTLTMFYNNSAGGVGVVGRVRRLTTAFVPSEVTWNRASTALAWTLAGGDYTETDRATWTGRAYGSTNAEPPSSFGYGEFEITGMNSLVQDAVSNRAGQLDLLFMLDDEGVNKAFHIEGRDSTNLECYNGTSHGDDCVDSNGCPGGVCAVGAPVLEVCYEV